MSDPKKWLPCDLGESFRNAIRKVANDEDKKREEAIRWFDSLSSEFRRRRCEGVYFPVPNTDGGLFIAPEKGMLSFLSYHVGEQSKWRKEERQRILEYAVEKELPPLLNESYCAKWGEPKTAERRNALKQEIRQFISNACSDPAKSRAVEDWNDDLDFLETCDAP